MSRGGNGHADATRRLTDALCDAGAEARRAGVSPEAIVTAYLVGATVHAAGEDGTPWTVDEVVEAARAVATGALAGVSHD